MPLSTEEQRSMEILKSTTVLTMTKLFFQIVILDGNTMDEAKIAEDTALANNLNLQIRQYEVKDYARNLEPVERQTINPRISCFLLFSVVHPNEPDKIRIKWDSAAKSNGVYI